MERTDGFPAQPGDAVAAATDPLGLLAAATDLLDPVAAAWQLPWLTGEMLGIATGQSAISVQDHDRKFADAAWQSHPLYHQIGQQYRLFEQWMDRMVAAAPGGWARQARTRYLANIITGAASPANFLPTNPAALRRAFETGGMSLVKGAQNMLRDLAQGGMPSTVDRGPFPVGEKLACTPGAVVYRDEMIELLQYAPSTPSVRSRPLLMVPPQLNRYYVLDLAPGRSMVEYALQQGIQTFMIVWRNPRPGRGHGRWGLDDYLAAQGRAVDVVKQITGSQTVNWLGLCAGGITTALYLGHLAAKGDKSVHSATFIVTMLANDQPNVVGQFDSEGSQQTLRRAAEAGQILPASLLRASFAWLRPDDLVFNYLVSGWLLGEDPPAFDILAWNDDATAMTAKLSYEMTQMVTHNQPSRPGAVTVLGTPIDLGQVDCDSFHITGYTDHITPWRACYPSTQILGGSKHLVVVRSGHIQSFVNPVEGGRYDYWESRPAAPDPDQWLDQANLHSGSWWPRWAEWITARSGDETPAPDELGSRAHPPAGAAPGTYVHE